MTEEKSKQGKKNRRKGGEFELKVRHDLESKGWICAKWMNQVEFGKVMDIGKLIPAKRKYNPFNKAFSIGSGFPDFIAFKLATEFIPENDKLKEIYKKLTNAPYHIFGIEAKSNGYLDKEEKRKCIWLLENKIFSKILIAKKIKGGIEYKDFKCG